MGNNSSTDSTDPLPLTSFLTPSNNSSDSQTSRLNLFTNKDRAIIHIKKQSITFLSQKPNKFFELSIDFSDFNFEKTKEKILDGLNKTFGSKLSEYFSTKPLSFLLISNENNLIEEESLYNFFTKELQIKCSAKIITEKKLLCEFFKNDKEIYDPESTILLFILTSKQLIINSLLNLNENLADFLISENDGKLITCSNCFLQIENVEQREKFAIIVLYQVLLMMNRKIGKVVINAENCRLKVKDFKDILTEIAKIQKNEGLVDQVEIIEIDSIRLDDVINL